MRYRVKFECTQEYSVVIEADSAEEARLMVQAGEYDDRDCDLVDEYGFEVHNAELVTE